MTSINSKNNKSFTLTYFKGCIFATLIGTIILFVVMALSAFFMIKFDKYEAVYPIITILLQCIPAFISGKSVGKAFGHSLLVLGVLEGILTSLVFLIISLIFFTDKTNFNALLSSIPYIIASAALGSITASKKGKK